MSLLFGFMSMMFCVNNSVIFFQFRYCQNTKNYLDFFLSAQLNLYISGLSYIASHQPAKKKMLIYFHPTTEPHAEISQNCVTGISTLALTVIAE